MPFIGAVPIVSSRVRNIRIPTREGHVQLPFRFFYAENGGWVRAEYEAEGNQYSDIPMDRIENLMNMDFQKVIGIPATDKAGNFSNVFEVLEGEARVSGNEDCDGPFCDEMDA